MRVAVRWLSIRFGQNIKCLPSGCERRLGHVVFDERSIDIGNVVIPERACLADRIHGSQPRTADDSDQG